MITERDRSIDLSPWDSTPILDHAGDQRDPDDIARAWRDPRTRLLLIDRESRFRDEEFGVPVDGDLDDRTAFLGVAEGVPWFARRAEPLDDGVTIRDPALSGLQYQVVSAGLAVLNWIESARYCSRCGGGLRRTKGGFAAVCLLCGREHFPRTDPAVIVAVLDPDDRVFLAHQGTWAAGRASILAGFVEAGESAENAVHRELAEEASLVIDSLHFLGSQPWPFPRSLMLAYVARSRSAGTVDGEELEWGGWYSRQDVETAVGNGELSLPGPGSVARRVLDAWRAGSLPLPE
ncbi:NAD(+) diphosphatase [Brooklawnia cerclae]|uniref:NAD(+) diphosphatase n=1 Tax=Brooklawnia cerclae TaxID=349934 RepID=A0ABX0SEQ9_9ACTN|nr:NAD(+) diphosphatase [Brooklawnia cerclae]NIH56369.1 NAD+ diphosphatase [Brooklawnia cerclae]